MAPARILIVRLSALGDVIHTMPLAWALKDRFPETHITWVVEEASAALLRGHTAIDELIEIPHGFLKSPWQLWRLARRLRSSRFDVAIDAQGLAKSAVVVRLSGTRRRIGFGRPWGRECSRWLNNDLVDTVRPHAVDRNLELLHPLGIVDPPVRFDVPELPAERAFATDLLRQLGVRCTFATIAVGAGWASKRWPVGRYAALARWLGQQHNLPTLVIWGNLQEREWAEQLVADSDGFARQAPKMTLAQLAAVVRRGRLFVGADSGPLHLAAAVGTACVGLYGPWPAEKHGPYGSQHIALQKLVMYGSTWQRRHAPPTYIEAITVDMVCEACGQILGRPRREAA